MLTQLEEIVANPSDSGRQKKLERPSETLSNTFPFISSLHIPTRKCGEFDFQLLEHTHTNAGTYEHSRTVKGWCCGAGSWVCRRGRGGCPGHPQAGCPAAHLGADPERVRPTGRQRRPARPPLLQAPAEALVVTCASDTSALNLSLPTNPLLDQFDSVAGRAQENGSLTVCTFTKDTVKEAGEPSMEAVCGAGTDPPRPESLCQSPDVPTRLAALRTLYRGGVSGGFSHRSDPSLMRLVTSPVQRPPGVPSLDQKPLLSPWK